MAVDKRTYPTWLNGEVKSVQKEYTEPTKLLDENGNLLSPGFARRNVFEYNRSQVVPKMRSKEWDFYQISNGKYAVQLNFANISFGGFISAKLIDLHNKQHDRELDANTVVDATVLYLGGREKYKMPYGLTAKEQIAEKIGKSERTVKTIMNSLEEKGVISREGGKRFGYWKLNI